MAENGLILPRDHKGLPLLSGRLTIVEAKFQESRSARRQTRWLGRYGHSLERARLKRLIFIA